MQMQFIIVSVDTDLFVKFNCYLCNAIFSEVQIN